MNHDIKVMLSNACDYFAKHAKNADMSEKMSRLSDWFERKLSKNADMSEKMSRLSEKMQLRNKSYCSNIKYVTRPHVNSGTRASGWQRIRNYNNQLDDNFLEGLKNLSLNPRTTRNRRIPRKRCFVCRKKGHTRHNYPSKQAANDPMDKSLMANDQVKIDADYVQLHYDTIGLKEIFSWKELTREIGTKSDSKSHNAFFLFTHGVGVVLIGTNKATYEIRSVSFVSEIGINVLSLHQLACQGFEVQVSGTTCVIRRMFDEANEEMTTKEEVEIPLKSSKGKRLNNDEGNSECIMWAGLDIDSEQDTNSRNKDTRQLTVNSFEGFIRFIKLANSNKVVLKHREIFRECFESMLKWFHNTYIEGDVTKLMPPTIGGYEICLFDLSKLVKCFGGYERLNYKKKWDEVSFGLGFSRLYGLMFKEIYVLYLLIPETYFEVAKVGVTSTDDYIRENCLVIGNNEVSMMSEHVNEVDIEGTSRD
nr:putative ARID DNA-binding domain-containing protein [Tanacetum cinerariifolium]